MLQLRRKKEPPAGLLKRTYQNELRAMGRHCDDQGLKSIGIHEVTDGFILRAFPDANNPTSVVALEIPDGDLQSLILKNFTAQGTRASAAGSRLCPTGYEDFLRALGFELEECQAKAIAMQELSEGFSVAFYQPAETADGGFVWEPKSFILTAEHVQDLLDEAFKRRGR